MGPAKRRTAVNKVELTVQSTIGIAARVLYPPERLRSTSLECSRVFHLDILHTSIHTASHYFPGENPLGKRFEKIGDDPHPIAHEIVGVVRDAKFNNLREPAWPTAYEPLRRFSATLEVRTAA